MLNKIRSLFIFLIKHIPLRDNSSRVDNHKVSAAALLNSAYHNRLINSCCKNELLSYPLEGIIGVFF